MLVILTIGIAVPAWVVVGLYAGQQAASRRLAVDGQVGDRYVAYVRIIRDVWGEVRSEENLAPVVIAALRELHKFPEFGDLTVLLIDEISVHGSTHFDQLMKQEVSQLQTSLLDQKYG